MNGGARKGPAALTTMCDVVIMIRKVKERKGMERKVDMQVSTHHKDTVGKDHKPSAFPFISPRRRPELLLAIVSTWPALRMYTGFCSNSVLAVYYSTVSERGDSNEQYSNCAVSALGYH